MKQRKEIKFKESGNQYWLKETINLDIPYSKYVCLSLLIWTCEPKSCLMPPGKQPDFYLPVAKDDLCQVSGREELI